MKNNNPEQPKGPPRPKGPPVAKEAQAEHPEPQRATLPVILQQSDSQRGKNTATADWRKPSADVTGDAPEVGIQAGTLLAAYADWIEQKVLAGGASAVVIAANLLGTLGQDSGLAW